MADYEKLRIGNLISLSHHYDEVGQKPVRINNIEGGHYILDQEDAPALTEDYMISLIPTSSILEYFGFQPAKHDNESLEKFEKYFISHQDGVLVPGLLTVKLGPGLATSEVKLNNVDETKKYHTPYFHIIQNLFLDEYHLDILMP